MRVQGETELAGAPAAIFAHLLDPAVLQRCIPGCEALQDQGAGVFEARVKVGVGAIKGTFKARVTLTDVLAPQSYRLGLEAKSPVGFSQGSATITLTERESATHLTWDGEVKISGLIAAVGQRLLGAAVRKFSNDFFSNLAQEAAPPA